MKFLGKLFLSGLLAVIPLALTIYVLIWLVSTVESVFSKVLVHILPAEFMLPGLGLVTGVVFLTSIGLLLKGWLFQRIFQWGESMLARLPLVKSLYASLRDLTRFISQPKDREMGQVVKVDLGNNITVLGFLTCEDLTAVNKNLPDDNVAVYMPLSYQIGGHLLMVPRSSIEIINMPMNEALRFTITGGMTVKQQNAGSATL